MSDDPLECYVCGKDPYKSCHDFEPTNPDFKMTCPGNMRSCVKSYGAFENVTGTNIEALFNHAHFLECRMNQKSSNLEIKCLIFWPRVSEFRSKTRFSTLSSFWDFFADEAINKMKPFVKKW